MPRTHEDHVPLRTVQLRLSLLPDVVRALSEQVPSVRPVRPPAVILPNMMARMGVDEEEEEPPTDSVVTDSFTVQLDTPQLLDLILPVGRKRTDGSRAPASALIWSRSCWTRVATSVVATSATSKRYVLVPVPTMRSSFGGFAVEM